MRIITTVLLFILLTVASAFAEEFIYVYIGQDVLTIKPERNSSANAFIDILRKSDLTVEMHDYGNFEKVGSIGISLPQNDKPITTKPGDVIHGLLQNLAKFKD